MLKRTTMAVLFLAVASLALGQSGKPPKPVDPNLAALQKLQQEYMAAERVYYKPYDNVHTQEEASKIHLDPKKNPAIAYLGKFKALAMKSANQSVALQAWMMTRSMAEATDNQKEAENAVATIMAKYAKSPMIAQFVSTLSYAYMNLAPPVREKKISAMLEKIQQQNPSPEVKATAMYAHAQLIARDGRGDAAGAAKIYEQIIAKFPNTSPGKRAKGDLFEMENLVPGKVAPDFDAEDQDGAQFKLSDYRGKVVVLDFWGFW